MRAGRSFASATVTVRQGDRTCATSTVLLDYPQPDVIRRDRWTFGSGPPAAGPEAAFPADMPMRGRQVRAGMSYVRGQVLTEEGCLVASFTQDAMIRAFAPNGSATSVPLEARL